MKIAEIQVGLPGSKVTVEAHCRNSQTQFAVTVGDYVLGCIETCGTTDVKTAGVVAKQIAATLEAVTSHVLDDLMDLQSVPRAFRQRLDDKEFCDQMELF